MTDNVIPFPKYKKNTPPQTIEELIESIEVVRKEHIEYIIDETVGTLFNRCFEDQISISNKEFIKSVLLVEESLRSLLYAATDMDHPLQMISETMFVLEGEEIPLDIQVDLAENPKKKRTKKKKIEPEKETE